MSTRELSVAAVFHPEHLRRGQLLLVDEPVVRPIQDGAPTLGWEGDPRLAVYLHLRDKRFEVWRFEADGKYRRAFAAPPGRTLTPEAVNRLIGKLVAIDSRRGFDAVAEVDMASDAAEAEAERRMTDRVQNDLADRLAHAFERAGATDYL